MEERERAKNKPIELDWDKLLPRGAEEKLPVLVIVKSGEAMESMENQMSDHDLLEKIERIKASISNFGASMPDKGHKLLNFLKRLEDQRDKRNLRTKTVETIHLEESDELDMPVQAMSCSTTGGLKDFKRVTATSQNSKDSSLASIFYKRLNESLTKDGESNAFEKEVSLLGQCDQHKTTKELSQKRKHGSESGPRHSPPKRHKKISCERGKQVLSNGLDKGRASSTCFEGIRERSLNSFYHKNILSDKDDCLPVSNSSDVRPRKERTIVVVDDEEPKLEETLEQLEKPDESMKDVRIYYPSRKHPEAVEISYTDFDCLAPQAYLKSNVMNFYIRYLQQHASPTNSVMRNCHFFNTYFYAKLKEVLSRKGNSRDEFFIKFRRWWKGINIFHKEYILIPINEEEEQSGPIILHLDSLGLHSSKSVFQNIKSYLQEEWNHLRQEASSPDPPFSNHIWENLPRKIVDNPIAVPQQKNDYDCGLFVLYFMERFIEDAPGRLKKKDLAMFGRKWFKPEEASGLRVKIHKLLMEEFQNAKEANETALQSSPPSSASSLRDVLLELY